MALHGCCLLSSTTIGTRLAKSFSVLIVSSWWVTGDSSAAKLSAVLAAYEKDDMFLLPSLPRHMVSLQFVLMAGRLVNPYVSFVLQGTHKRATAVRAQVYPGHVCGNQSPLQLSTVLHEMTTVSIPRIELEAEEARDEHP